MAVGDLQVVANGYLTNRAALVTEGHRRGHDPDEASPGHLLGLAYRWWGPELPRRVDGRYAAVIHDPARSTLALVHDELGLAPLFYAAAAAGTITIASHLDDLVVETGPGDLDEEYIADFLAVGEHLGPRTPYGHIRRLCPGQSLIVWDGHVTECGTWTLDQVSPIAYRDPRDYEEHLRQVVTEAVTAALPPAGPVWCELSGGLDSSTVFGLAARAGAPGLGALSFVYPESPGADERDWIRLVLDRHPAPWHAIDADAARPFTEAPAGRPREPTFSLLESGWNRCYTSTLRSHGVAAVLTGMGGDEVFGSHTPKPFYLSDLLLQEQMDDLASELEGWVAQDEAHGSAASWLTRFAVAPAVAHASGEHLDYLPVRIPWASDAFAHRTGLSERGRRSAVPPTETVGHSWFLAGVLACAHAVSIGLVDREEAAELRHPLLHRPLVAFMAGVPWTTKLRPGPSRALQRRALQGILPDALLERRDKPALNEVFLSGLASSSSWQDRLTARSRLAELGYVDARRWREAVRDAAAGRAAPGIRYLLASACLEIWLQQLDACRPSPTGCRLRP